MSIKVKWIVVVALGVAIGTAHAAKGVATSKDPTYGYSKKNPIKVGLPGKDITLGPRAEKLYLRRLRDAKGRPFKYKRVGSVGAGPDGHVLDKYELIGADGKKFYLFLDMYHPKAGVSRVPIPKGLFVRAAKRRISKRPTPSNYPAMQKVVTQKANFALYVPKDWRVSEGVSGMYRTCFVSDPGGNYGAAMFHGVNPTGNQLLPLARHFIGQIGKRFPDLRITRAQALPDGTRITFDGVFTFPKRGQREFRGWIQGKERNFSYFVIEAPKGRLAKIKPMLLTILANIHVTKGAYRFSGSGQAPVVQPLVPYRLRDGSASFKMPRTWRVQDYGQGIFVANDPSGRFSFIVAGEFIITPQLGVRVPGTICSGFLRPHQALKMICARKGIAHHMRFEGIIPRNDLVRQMGRVYTAGTCAVEDFIYTCTSKGQRIKGFTMGMCFYARMGTNWMFRHLTVAAPADQFEAFIPTFIAMLQSYKVDTLWARNYVARGMARLRQMQRQTSALIERNARDIRQMMNAAYQERMRSQDYIDYQRTNYIRGQQDWISNLEGGNIYRSDHWGLQTPAGEHITGKPFNYYNFTGRKVRGGMTPINSRRLWEKHIRGR